MSKPIVLITGGNTGIGWETVKALAESDTAFTILMGSRSLDKAKDGIKLIQDEIKASSSSSSPSSSKSDIVPIQIDIEDDASIGKCFDEVKRGYGKVDVLVNNAGAAYDIIASETPGPKGVREAWDRSYSVNVTSTQVFTQTFMPLLLAPSPTGSSTTTPPRLLFITSGLSSLTTCASGHNMGSATTQGTSVPKGWPKPAEMTAVAYRSSKTALNMMMLDWVRLLNEDGVKVFAISPGFLATGLGGAGKERLKSFGAGDASMGGVFIRDVVLGKRDADAGLVINRAGTQPCPDRCRRLKDDVGSSHVFVVVALLIEELSPMVFIGWLEGEEKEEEEEEEKEEEDKL
ncbi:NAD(P)-binding protein [Pleomassaria siparia CBS 279.74]|uniref:NAD(P)-binding protein n=1 Tax=Pleomassaria siparia CBS 279.74 TaxID=1314801 RepID=A0A6G1KNR7_9PLEO|nr:NAD(P)-binding protein [Pleomassaria siparia CBS 279.74]